MSKRSSTSMNYGPGAWKLIGRGMELGAVIGGMTYLGYLGDEYWGTGPWLTFTGAVLATVGGSYNLAKDMLLPKQSKGSSGNGTDQKNG